MTSSSTVPAPRHPDPFLEVRHERLDVKPELFGWCAGYEEETWRAAQLARHLVEWLPEFALRYSEWQALGSHNAVALIAKAAESVYTSTKYQKRGEFGEILLHAMIRQRFKSIPAISKYFYKDSSNDTVKGFDAVHVVGAGGEWELWLGEVKFYSDINSAISDVVRELQEHVKRDYLRAEFTAITNKLDDTWGDATKVRELLNKSTSLDKIFARICIPVLLTYDSDAVASHKAVTAEFTKAFVEEVSTIHKQFAAKTLPRNVTVRLFLLPMNDKKRLLDLMDKELKKWQNR